MKVRFYMDEHLQSAVTEELRRKGVDVVTVQEDGYDAVDDGRVLDRALDLGRVIFTQDKDFLRIAADRQRHSLEFVGVIYAPQRGISVGQCVSDLELIAGVLEPSEMMNRVWRIPIN